MQHTSKYTHSNTYIQYVCVCVFLFLFILLCFLFFPHKRAESPEHDGVNRFTPQQNENIWHTQTHQTGQPGWEQKN